LYVYYSPFDSLTHLAPNSATTKGRVSEEEEEEEEEAFRSSTASTRAIHSKYSSSITGHAPCICRRKHRKGCERVKPKGGIRGLGEDGWREGE